VAAAGADAATVFLTTIDDRHLQRIGGLTALERRIREVAKAGATRAIVATAPVDFGRAMPIPIEFVAPGSPPPEAARIERADVIAGLELTDDETRRRAEWTLIRRMNKSFEGPVDALINWRISMRITRVLSHRSLAVTPNQVTICAILVGIAAAAVATTGTYLGFVAAAALLQLNSILDSVDGELARLRFQYSKLGQWLDNISDDLVDNLFIVAVGYTLGGAWFVLAVIAASERIAVSIVTYLDVYRRTGTGDVFAFRWWFEKEKVTADEIYDPTSPVVWFRSLGRRDTYVFVWLLACVCVFPNWVPGHAIAMGTFNFSLHLLHFTVFRKRR
jgi:phosphatidylglycerophosphate synthase